MRPVTALLLCLLYLLAGCSTVSNAVDASATLSSSLYAPLHYEDKDFPVRLKDLNRNGAMGEKERAFVFDYLNRINFNYNKYVTNLTSGKASTNIMYDSVNLGLTGGAAVASHVATKTGLAALGTFFQGQKQSIDKNIFNDQAIFALTSIMEVRRTEVLGRFRESLANSKYTLGSALIDLDEYYRAGSLQNALQASFLNQARLPANDKPEQAKPVLPSSTNPLK